MPEDPGTDPLGDPADHSALSGCVAAFEDHNDPGACRFDPGLQAHELHLEASQLALELLPLHPSFDIRVDRLVDVGSLVLQELLTLHITHRFPGMTTSGSEGSGAGKRKVPYSRFA